MDRLNKSGTPGLSKINDLNLLRIKMDGKGLTDDINGKPTNLNFLSKKENQRMENKSIVNNKPSQYGPILGVNFHNIKR